MIQVLISTSTFPIKLDDGLPRFVYDLAGTIAKKCDVIVLAPDAPGSLKREFMGRMDVQRFSYFYPRRWQALAYGYGMRDNLRSSLLGKIQLFPFIGNQALATRRIVHKNKIRVVNSHWMVPQGFSSALARGRKRRFHHILSVHAGDVYMLQGFPFGRFLARFIIDRTDFIFADGSKVRDQLDQLLGRPSNAIVQPMGVHVNQFNNSGAEPFKSPFPEGYLLYFGRFSEKKGIPYLLKAMPKILGHHPGLGLIIVGYGMREKELKKEVSDLKIEPSVQFVGRKTHDEIIRYLQGSRVAVIPSIIDRYGETEGMPTTVIEAMASGTRVVASDVDGIPDVISHQENGWLCRPKDPADLAEKILMALVDPAPSKILKLAKETAENFDWSKVADRYIKVINILVKNKK